MNHEIVLATGNPHKLKEVREILEPVGIRILGLDDLEGPFEEPVEDGLTFRDNAAKKALGYARLTGRACLAEDSGLVVDALEGAPGVHSARYAGVGESRAERDQANNDKLLSALAGVPTLERTARFVCVMCLATPDGRILAETEGSYEGLVAEAPRGDGGFGYDPLLYLSDVGRTSAELSPEEKHARSHRGAAARRMAEVLPKLDLG